MFEKIKNKLYFAKDFVFPLSPYNLDCVEDSKRLVKINRLWLLYVFLLIVCFELMFFGRSSSVVAAEVPDSVFVEDTKSVDSVTAPVDSVVPVETGDILIDNSVNVVSGSAVTLETIHLDIVSLYMTCTMLFAFLLLSFAWDKVKQLFRL